MTIYEKIKTLSVEEMAEFLTECCFGCVDCEEGRRLCDNPLTKDDPCDEKCYDHCLSWLKQKAAEPEQCPYYFIDDVGQGFTVPCCSLGKDPRQVASIISKDPYITFVKCKGDKSQCETGVYKSSILYGDKNII